MPRWPDAPTFEEWLAARVRVEDRGFASPCWLWTGALTEKGYAKSGAPALLGLGWKTIRVHRIAYQRMVGPIPDGLILDHLCRVRHCCNPSHVEPVTVAENNARTPPELRTTTFKPGHKHNRPRPVLTPERIIEKRAARAAYMREYKRKRRAAGLPTKYPRRAG